MTDPPQLLLVEDDAPLRRSLLLALRDEGFAVREAATGREGFEQLSCEPAAVLLDVGLPDVDGLELCRRIRPLTASPIVIISVQKDPGDLARALEAGADDYLGKPFAAADLARRLRGLLQPPPLNALALGALTLDVHGRGHTSEGRPVALTRTELRVLAELAAALDTPVARDVLLARVWGLRPAAGPGALDARVRSLQTKLAGAGGAVISAVDGGYRLQP